MMLARDIVISENVLWILGFILLVLACIYMAQRIRR